jgi:hypothetical protein
LGEEDRGIGICPALTNADNAQSLVDEDGVVGNVVSTPIGAAVLDLLAHANGRGPELLHIWVPGDGGSNGQRMVNVNGSADGWWGRAYWWQAKIPHILPALWCRSMCMGVSLLEQSKMAKKKWIEL